MTTTKVNESETKEIPTRSQPEDATAAFGFFRRHQKLIIYTAGLFTLLTFSITGAVMSVSEQFSQDIKMPELEVPGELGKVEITPEDDAVGRMIRTLKNFQDQGYDLMAVVPFIATSDNSDDPARFAALRSLAVGTGVEASDDDAELAMQGAMLRRGIQSLEDLAVMHGVHDKSRFATVVREALRVTTFLRLAVLGVGTSSTQAVQSILKDNDEIGFLVADLDLDAIKKRLEKTEVSDAELQKFLKELDEQGQSKYRHPTNKAAFEVAFVSTAGFDPASHKDDLKDYKPGDAEIRSYYDRYKDYFQVEPPKKKEEKKDEKKENEKENAPPASKPAAKKQEDPQPASLPTSQPTDTKPAEPQKPTYRPLDEVKEEITRKLQLKRVLQAWRKQLDAKVAEHMQPAFDARLDAADALAQAEKAEKEAKEKADKKPEGKELAAALEVAKKAVEASKKAHEAAEEAVTARLESFGFKGAVESLAKEAVVFASVPEAKFAEDLKELPADLGTWSGSFAATSVAKSGEIHSSVQDVKKGAFLLRVTDLVERPFKDFAEVKEDLKVHYYTDKADKEGREKKEKLEKALERLSKEKGKDAIAAIEKKTAEQLKQRVDKWRGDLQKEIEACNKLLVRSDEGSWRHKKLKAKRDAFQERLAGEKEYADRVKEELDKETKDEIKDIQKKHYKEILAEAAKESGFELVEVGPHTKRLSQRPRFEKGYSKLVQFLFSDPELMRMEEGEATDILEDKTERRICVAACTTVRKAESKSITRREWKSKQDGLTIFAMRERIIDNPQVLWPLLRAFQRNPALQPLQQLFYEVIGGKNKEKARELAYHPQFLPLLQQMVNATAPYSGSQKQMAANQSFTIEALKKGYGWHDPSAAKHEPTAKKDK